MTEIDKLCSVLVKEKSLQPEFKKDGSILQTHCNHFVQRVCSQIIDYHEFEGLFANQIYLKMEEKKEWTPCGDADAVHFSQNGKLSIAAQENKNGHGHIAVISSEPMQKSGSWKKDVPMLWNVGHKNGLLRTSQCFLTEPEYFVFHDD